MAYTSIYAHSGAILIKAGPGANATLKSSATNESGMNYFSRQAEAFINVASRVNWSDAYATLNSDVRYLLEEAGSNLGAIYVINYDMSGYTSRSEAETMINALKLRADECIKLLVDQKKRSFIEGA